MLVLENGTYIVKEEEQNESPAISYEEMVVSFIREKYSLNEELAINRQRDSKPEEFQAYFNYCEECKIKARELLTTVR